MLKTYFLLTLGCQMNHSDSERIEFVLSSFGLKSAPEEKADLILVNSCSVRQKPIDRIWGKVKVWNNINPNAKKILTGCVLPSDLKKLKEKFDYYFKIDDLRDFDQWLEKHFSPNNIAKKINYLEIKPKRLDKKTAYVPIMSGCNNFCSYCAVPYTRGREWSRRPSTIIKEVRCLAEGGYKKILLLGQNVNSYHSEQITVNPDAKVGIPHCAAHRDSKQNKNSDFVELLRKLVTIPGDFEINFMSPHPKDFSDQLIDLIAKEPKISKEIHLPMQSGDNKILEKMNRGYKANDYLALIQKMRRKIKDLRISTDIIVGFPDETEQKFRNTVRLIKSSRISKAYISIYSPRNGTLAQKKFADSVPYEIKKKRWLILEKLINKSEIRNPNDESNPKSE